MTKPKRNTECWLYAATLELEVAELLSAAWGKKLRRAKAADSSQLDPREGEILKKVSSDRLFYYVLHPKGKPDSIPDEIVRDEADVCFLARNDLRKGADPKLGIEGLVRHFDSWSANLLVRTGDEAFDFPVYVHMGKEQMKEFAKMVWKALRKSTAGRIRTKPEELASQWVACRYPGLVQMETVRRKRRPPGKSKVKHRYLSSLYQKLLVMAARDIATSRKRNSEKMKRLLRRTLNALTRSGTHYLTVYHLIYTIGRLPEEEHDSPKNEKAIRKLLTAVKKLKPRRNVHALPA
jgi:hypothetical protein